MGGLLLVIALNKIRKLSDYHSAKKRVHRRSVSLDNGFDTGRDGGTEEEVALSVLNMTIEELVQSLPENYQQIIQLRIEGNSLPEIADKTARAKRTVERVLQQFRASLLNPT